MKKILERTVLLIIIATIFSSCVTINVYTEPTTIKKYQKETNERKEYNDCNSRWIFQR